MAKTNYSGAAAAPRRSTRERRQVESIYDEAAKAEDLKMKRAKTAAASPRLNICDLPDSVLLHITSYIQDTSRVLLAVALTASSSSWRKSNWKIKPSAASIVILSGKTIRNFSSYIIDFVDMDKGLAAKLSDEDVGGVLASIGALHTIRRVKFTHCVGITGKGLEPLRGSIHLESIDLSLVGTRCSPNLNPEAKLSKMDVIPILDSILDAEGCTLKHVQFPKKWRMEQSQLLGRFLAKYNRVMNSRNIVCHGEREVGRMGGMRKNLPRNT